MLLIINDSKRDAERTSDILFFMGIASYGATYSEALSEISEKYSAVLIFSEGKPEATVELILRLRSYCAAVPIFVSRSTDLSIKEYCNGVFDEKKSIANIIKQISLSIEKENKRLPGFYNIMGLDASANLNSTLFFDEPISFTRTENMILRVLIRHYPIPLLAENILKYAFKKSNKPDLSNVRTHISVINKKFRAKTGRNLVEMKDSEGYIIMTPEYLEKKKILTSPITV